MSMFDKHIDKMLQSTIRLCVIVVLLLTVIYLLSGIYSIAPGEIGVHLRCGRLLDGQVGPGIHFALPSPIDQIHKVPVKMIKSIVIDDFIPSKDPTSPANKYTRFTGLPTYCITGDNNTVVIDLTVQYQIRNAAKYLFGALSPEKTLVEVAKNSVIQCLSTKKIDSILTSGKKAISDYIRTHINHKLDTYGLGLYVQFVDLKNINPPNEVQKFFDDVINASIDRRKKISEAENYYNLTISAAQGRAEKLKQEAHAYQEEQIAKAKGESSRYLDQLSEYQKNPGVARQNLFADFMDSFADNQSKRIMIDQNQAKTGEIRLIWPK